MTQGLLGAQRSVGVAGRSDSMGFAAAGRVEGATAAASRSQGPLLQVWVDHCERCGVSRALFLVVATQFLCASCSRERGLL